MTDKRFFQRLILPLLLLAADFAFPHGSVTAEDDICVIRVGFYSAHFKIFQPESSGSREFCEDLPAAGESIFVMEYLHQALGEVPIEFRIIRNETGLGRFTRLEDIQGMDDIDALTVFHRNAVVEKDVYTIRHEFAGDGDFVGVVSVGHPGAEEAYMAVFPFHVGRRSWGIAPWILALAALTQLLYWHSSGALRRWYLRSFPALALLLLSVSASSGLRAEQLLGSEQGYYRASLRSAEDPVPLNRIHDWIVHLETADGEPVEGAALGLEGGMPAHDHGLPTAPLVTRYLGNGDYRVEGVRFHMLGLWELVLSIEHQGRSDTVRAALEL